MHSLILASEGFVPEGHVAANMVIPISAVIFVGSVYMFLWANYGAKKGAAIYGVALGGFCTMLGVFWWFGAPGTPVATGLQNFPGQAADAYTGGWYGFEAGSERGEIYGITEDSLGGNDFVTVETFLGGTEESLEGNKQYNALNGDLEQGVERAKAQFFPEVDGTLQIGSERRQAWNDNIPDPEVATNADGDPFVDEATGDALLEQRADPFFTPVIEETLISEDSGTRLVQVNYSIQGRYLNPDFTESRTFLVEEGGTWFALKDPGALWFPSAVWTGISFILFLVSMVALDRMEMREKEEEADEVLEAEDLRVPVHQ